MKTMNKTLAWMLAAIMSLALISTADAQSNKERTGKVVRIKGDARYSTGNKVWQPLKVGATLKSGYIVQTAMNSFVDVVINQDEMVGEVSVQPATMSSSTSTSTADGGGGGSTPTPDQDVVRILDDTYLMFDSLKAVASDSDTVTETMLDLRKGSVFANVKKMAAASRFEVKTPRGVAGIRGTAVLIKATGDIACLTGSAISAYTDSAGNVGTQVVGAGQEFNASTQQVGAITPGALGALNDMMSQTSYSTKGKPPGVGGGRPPGSPPYGPPGGVPPGHDHVSKHKP